MSEPFAYSVDEAAKNTDLGRSKLFEEIKAGNLRAKKVGRRTIVLAEDLRKYLRNLPEQRDVAKERR